MNKFCYGLNVSILSITRSFALRVVAWLRTFIVLPHGAAMIAIKRATFYIDIVSFFVSPHTTLSHDLDYLDDLITGRWRRRRAVPSLTCVWQLKTKKQLQTHSPASSVCSWMMRLNGRSTLHYIWVQASPACGLISLFELSHSRRRRRASSQKFTIASLSHSLLWSRAICVCTNLEGKRYTLCVRRDCYGLESMIAFYDPQQTFNYIIADCRALARCWLSIVARISAHSADRRRVEFWWGRGDVYHNKTASKRDGYRDGQKGSVMEN